MDPTSATTTELTLALHEKQISSREVLDALLAHVEKRNPALNAVVTLDVDRALAAAAAADAATARGAPPAHSTACP
jgi:amidase